jgi:cell division protein FtsQ
MDLPAAGKKKFSFPVILGMNSGEPPSTRAARMKIYNDLVSQLDAGGAHYSQELSEVDLSDGEDVRVFPSDPQGEVLVHLGSGNYLERYKVYVSHVREWRQQFDKLESVDLRYDRQIIVNPDLQGTAKQPPVSKLSAKAALAAGMKPAALITHEVAPKSSAAMPVKAPAEVAAKKKTAKKAHHKAEVKAKLVAGPPLNKNVAKVSPPAAQPAAAPSAAPQGASAQTPSMQNTSGQTTTSAPATTGTVAVKPGSKPSPAIAKGEEHP